MDALEKQN